MLCFAKLKENFANHEITNFAKFSQKQENKFFRIHPRCESNIALPESSESNIALSGGQLV